MNLGPSTLLRFDDDAAWRAWRSEEGCVGGSELPRLLGLHTFKTQPGASTSAGHVLEPLVLERAARIRGWYAVRGWCARHATEPWRRGSLDALVYDGATFTRVVEIKVVFRGQAPLWYDGLPEHVLVQALWYMALTGLPVTVVALMVDGYGLDGRTPEEVAECGALRFYEVAPETHGAVMEATVEAVRRVRASGQPLAPRVPPPPPSPEQGGYDDGVLIANYVAAREDFESAVEAKRAAEAAREEAAARVTDLQDRLRSRVGLGGSLVAGGRRVTVGKTGTVRVR